MIQITTNGGTFMTSLSSHSPGALAAICSNLAKACEKQYRTEEFQLFNTLEQYFSKHMEQSVGKHLDELTGLIQVDLNETFVTCEQLASEQGDRGTLRALTWGKKVTSIHKSLLTRYAKQGEKLLDNGDLYICEACGFIAISSETPAMCPICKAPASRFSKVQ